MKLWTTMEKKNLKKIKDSESQAETNKICNDGRNMRDGHEEKKNEQNAKKNGITF